MRNVFTKYTCIIILFATTISGCKTIYPGEVGFIIHKGMIKPGILTQGRHHYNPFVSKICKFNTRIEEFSTVMSPPTKEGLEVKVDLTVLYHIKPEAAPEIYTNVGMDYGKKIVVNNFMAIVREYTMKYTAIELLNERETIEKNIEDKLRADISTYGIVLDDVLVKDIDMPTEVLHAIENKAKAEQIALQTKLELQTKREQEDFDIETKEKELKFSVEKQKNDSLMMQIDANAIKNYQNTINESLTDKLLKYKSIEITKELVKSPNAKIIITDGKTMMLNNIKD
ncbi:MAG TPA: prohibitin family protein [Puia sp.]|nr:prohibitin family protein [Puia sp.]